MKTSELLNWLDDEMWNYRHEVNEVEIFGIGTLYTNEKKFYLKNNVWDFVDIYDVKLLSVIIEYAKTPLQDREEEKRYKVRCKLTNRYLDKTFNGKLDWNSMRNSQRIFTLKELEELGIDVERYDLVEVEGV